MMLNIIQDEYIVGTRGHCLACHTVAVTQKSTPDSALLNSQIVIL